MPYFYNPQTSQSVWDTPDGLSPEQIRALPGASRFLGGANAQPASAPAAGGGKPGEVRASHILCKHAGSRRPSSWRQVSFSTLCKTCRVGTPDGKGSRGGVKGEEVENGMVVVALVDDRTKLHVPSQKPGRLFRNTSNTSKGYHPRRSTRSSRGLPRKKAIVHLREREVISVGLGGG